MTYTIGELSKMWMAGEHDAVIRAVLDTPSNAETDRLIRHVAGHIGNQYGPAARAAFCATALKLIGRMLADHTTEAR